MESTATPYRLKVKVGDSEFDAQGPEESVKAQFEMFLQAVNATPRQAQATRQQAASHGAADGSAAPHFAGHQELMGALIWTMATGFRYVRCQRATI